MSTPAEDINAAWKAAKAAKAAQAARRQAQQPVLQCISLADHQAIIERTVEAERQHFKEALEAERREMYELQKGNWELLRSNLNDDMKARKLQFQTTLADIVAKLNLEKLSKTIDTLFEKVDALSAVVAALQMVDEDVVMTGQASNNPTITSQSASTTLRPLGVTIQPASTQTSDEMFTDEKISGDITTTSCPSKYLLNCSGSFGDAFVKRRKTTSDKDSELCELADNEQILGVEKWLGQTVGSIELNDVSITNPTSQTDVKQREADSVSQSDAISDMHQVLDTNHRIDPTSDPAVNRKVDTALDVAANVQSSIPTNVLDHSDVESDKTLDHFVIPE